MFRNRQRSSSASKKSSSKQKIFALFALLAASFLVIVRTASIGKKTKSSLSSSSSSGGVIPPPGCGNIDIWSHRGHLDAHAGVEQNLALKCDTVLQTLYENNIYHIDIDILLYEGQLIVAHPTEVAGDFSSFVPSPCSRLPLIDFIRMVKNVYKEEYYITMEPKSKWENEENKALAPPQDVIGGILDILDIEPINDKKCGLILYKWQIEDDRIQPLHNRMFQRCEMSNPMRRDQSLRNEYPNHYYQLVMPTIELFFNNNNNDNNVETKTTTNVRKLEDSSSSSVQQQEVLTPDGQWYLNEIINSQPKIKTLVWIVDTEIMLRNVLELEPVGGISGVVSNNPVKLKQIMDQICNNP